MGRDPGHPPRGMYLNGIVILMLAFLAIPLKYQRQINKLNNLKERTTDEPS